MENGPGRQRLGQVEASTHQGRAAEVVRATSRPHLLILAVLSLLDHPFETTRIKLDVNFTLSHLPYSLVNLHKTRDHNLVPRRKSPDATSPHALMLKRKADFFQEGEQEHI